MLRKSKNLRDQASDLAGEVTDTLGPRVASARKAAVEVTREQVLPKLSEARENAAPLVAEARERFTEDVLPAVQQAVADAREQAGPLAEEARRRGVAAAGALRGEQPKRRGKKKWFALLALAGAIAVAAKKLLGGDSSGAPTYTPPTSPYAPPGDRVASPAPAATASPAGNHTGDPAGASPDEALADSTDQPRHATTPDDPAEVVDLTKES